MEPTGGWWRAEEFTAIIINDLDLGSAHPFAGPDSGIIVSPIVVEGANTISYGRAGKQTIHSVKLWVKAWQGIGGQAAGSISAMRYVLRQAQELAANRQMGPVYIRWTSSADPAAVLNTADLYDGWYWITSFKPEYTKVPAGLVPVQMQVVEVARGGSERRTGMAYSPSTPGLATNYSGATQLYFPYPLNSSNYQATSIARVTAEGTVPGTISPPSNLNPLPLSLSATTADWYKGGVKVYDTINTSSNPVPTSAGTFVNANWVRVFDQSHRFEGDCVVTNGLLLLLLQVGQGRVARVWLWNTALASAAWQQAYDFQYNDNAGNNGSLATMAIDRLGLESTIIRAAAVATSSGNQAEFTLRLERGNYFCRVDFRPLSQANTNNFTPQLAANGGGNLISYCSSSVADINVENQKIASPTDYGYGASFQRAQTTYPLLFGWLYQNQPTSTIFTANSSHYGGDNSGPAQNAIRSYAMFAVPFGVSGSYSPANLQAEGETTPTAPWVAVADATASGGNAAKLPSGTAQGFNSTNPQATWTPPSGTYRVAARVRTGTAGAGTTQEIYFGHSGNQAGSAKYLQPNQLTTSYQWFIGPAFTLSGSQTGNLWMVQNNQIPSVDWYVDELVLMPAALGAAYTGPQDLWQQFIADRTTRLVRL